MKWMWVALAALGSGLALSATRDSEGGEDEGGSSLQAEDGNYPVCNPLPVLQASGILAAEGAKAIEDERRAAVINCVMLELAKEPESQKVVPGTWTRGGCWVLADAVLSVFGGEMWVVSSDRADVEHFMVKMNDHFVDADGVHTDEGIIEKLKSQSGVPNPTLRPYEPSQDTDLIYNSAQSVDVTKRRLMRYLRQCAENMGAPIVPSQA